MPQTCIPARPGALPADEFAALAFIRVRMSQGTEARTDEFAQRDRVGTVARARELFDAVSHLTEVKGCSACPSAPLCTRDPETNGATT